MSDPRLRQTVRSAATQLREAGVASPDHDAAELLAHTLGTSRSRLWSVAAPQGAQLDRYESLIARRAAREPLQHLTGVAAFRHVDLAVGPGVFVPRPETELLAGWAIESASALTAPIVVDLCTGSGAIAKAVADEVPGAVVHAVELDEDALEWATRNLTGTGVALSQGDLASALSELDGDVDVVVCNPPYIPLEAWESVAPEARDHDPQIALFSGDDGLLALRRLEQRAADLLKPGGVVGAEHAEVQALSAPEIFSVTGRWTHISDHLDLAGRPRFVTARLAR